MYQRKIYDYMDMRKALECDYPPPIGVRWVDTNKGDDIVRNYRSRLVAMEFRRAHTETIFAGTPPQEALSILLSVAASEDPRGVADPYRIKIIDVKRAHFYAEAKRKLLINLPPEDPKSKDPNIRGRLLRTMYGTRDAAACWEAHYSKILEDAGMVKGTAAPGVFYC